MIQNMAPQGKRQKCWLHRIQQKNSYRLGWSQGFLPKHWPHLCLPALTFSCSSITFSSSFTWHPPNLILPPFMMSFLMSLFKAPPCPSTSLSASLSFLFSFCIFFEPLKKKLTFTAQCLPSWMRQKKSKRTSLFPTKDLWRVSVLWGDWTHRPEIC